MPDISPTRKLLQGFNTITDTGYLKADDGEYTWLQNVRGWGGAGRKRKGVQTLRTFGGGVMGWLDMRVDNDATVMDKILIVTGDGSLWSLAPEELAISFDYLINTTSNGKLYLQSPNLTWFDCTPTSAGAINPTEAAAPTTTITADQVIAQSEAFGFLFASVTWLLGVDELTQAIMLTEYPVVSGLTTYTTTRAFVTGVGPVLTGSTGLQYRVSVNNDSSLTTTEL
jgi:hypothetical protein